MLTLNRRLVLLAVVLSFTALLPGLAINRITWVPLGPALAKSAIYFLMTIVFVCLRPVAAFLQSLPKPHAVILSVFFVFLLFAQTVHRSAATFPFVSWHMYSEIPNAEFVEYFEFYAVDESGEEEQIYPAQMFPRLRRLTVYALRKWLEPLWKAQQTGEAAAQEPAPEKTGLKKMVIPVRAYFTEWPTLSNEEAARQLNRTLIALAVRHRQMKAGKPVHAVRVYHGRIRPAMYSRPELDQEPMWEVEIP